MSEPTTPEHELDTVTLLGMELSAAAKPDDPASFVEIVKRFVKAVLLEAFEHREEIERRIRGRNHAPAPGSVPEAIEKLGSMGAAAAATQAVQTKPPAHTASETPPAAPSPSSPKRRSPGSRSRWTAEEIEALRVAYRQAIADSDDGKLPIGWIGRYAESIGEPYQTVYGRVQVIAKQPQKIAEPAPSTAPPLSGSGLNGAGTSPAGQDAGEEESQPHAPPRADGSPGAALSIPAVRTREDETPQAPSSSPRAHGNSHNCWCRRSPCSTKNPWCAIEKPNKPIAGLTDPRPRVERYRPRY